MNAIEKAAVLSAQVSGLINELKEITKNRTIPLADRWEVFSQNAALFPTSKYYESGKDRQIIRILALIDEAEVAETQVAWYDDFCVDRYKTVDWVNIVENLEERFEEYINTQDVDDLAELENRYTMCMAELKDKILEEGTSGFTYDW